jgi:hypothetical protein
MADDMEDMIDMIDTLSISIFNIYIRKKTGELFTIRYKSDENAEQLHDRVYDSLSTYEKPHMYQKWKIMLFLRGQWIIADKRSVELVDGDVLDLVIDNSMYYIDFHHSHCTGDLLCETIKIRGSICADLPFYMNESTGFWHFDEEIEVDMENQSYVYKYNLYHPYNSHNNSHNSYNAPYNHIDAHEMLNRLDLPPCAKEYIYGKFFWCYADFLIPNNAPLPVSYYCNYEWDNDHFVYKDYWHNKQDVDTINIINTYNKEFKRL